MPQLYTDVLSFGEIGGVGEMIYHTVRFSEYSIEQKDEGSLLCPQCYANDEPKTKTDYALTGQMLLASLCNLYQKINDPYCEEPFDLLIFNWCIKNSHPYNIDDLYEMLSAEDFEIQKEWFLIEKDGTFSISKFIRDLSNVYHTFAFCHAIRELKAGNEKYAYNLYYEGKFDDGYPFFEKYKYSLPVEEKEQELQIKHHSTIGDEHFERNPLDYIDYLQNTLLSLFPEFKLKLKSNPRSKRIVYAADVQSIFDICWYTLSRMVADDAPALDVDDEHLFSQGSILSCLCCGEFFIRHGSRQKYCGSENCEAERNRKKAKANYIRKKNV